MKLLERLEGLLGHILNFVVKLMKALFYTLWAAVVIGYYRCLMADKRTTMIPPANRSTLVISIIICPLT
jgi:hypothetical protein